MVSLCKTICRFVPDWIVWCSSSLCEVELVGRGGFEPPTSPLSGARSNQLSYRPVAFCNAKRGRRRQIILQRRTIERRQQTEVTPDPVRTFAGDTLSMVQEHHLPLISYGNSAGHLCFAKLTDMVEPIGIEPMTPCLQSRCSPS